MDRCIIILSSYMQGNEDYRIIFINAYRVPTRDVACEVCCIMVDIKLWNNEIAS